MNNIIHLLNQAGDASLNLFWLPVIIWTSASLLVIAGLQLFKNKISAQYHYHLRLAMLWGLMIGVLTSVLFYIAPSDLLSPSASTPVFVIHNPISVTATVTESTTALTPAGWIGLMSMLCLIIISYGLIKFLIDFRSLKLLSSRINKQSFNELDRVSERNHNLLEQLDSRIQIALSDDVAIPCTFGWRRKIILIPAHFIEDAQKLNMALRHELMHIQNKDFLLNQSSGIIRALFFFHPLVHRLVATLGEYREICCDQRVLQDRSVSPKGYARLLLELSPKSFFKTPAAVSMAVRPSTLKKRIQHMKNSAPKPPSLKWSLSLMLVSTLLITGLMACSDMENNGITKSEVQRTQTNTYHLPQEDQPLFLLNNEKWDQKNISRLKPKYIQSINVLKGKKATDKYGKAGKNGIVQITLSVDKETALNDLQSKEEMQALADSINSSNGQFDKDEVYITVKKEPKMMGGRQALYKHLKYPKECQQAGVEGKVMLQFIVTKQGEVKNPQVLQGIGHGCDEAALKAIKQVKFKPARQRGKAVNMQYAWPITFKLPNK